MPCRIRRNTLKPVANSLLAHLPWPSRYESPSARWRPRSTDVGWTHHGKPDPTSVTRPVTARHGRPDPTVAGSQVHHNHGATPKKLDPSPTASGLDRSAPPRTTVQTPSTTVAPFRDQTGDDLWSSSIRPTKSGIHHNHGATPHKLGPSPTAAGAERPSPVASSGSDDLWANSIRPTKAAYYHRLSATARPETWVDIDA